ncbi:MAG: hypothetical protein H6737_19110 [Alphaproteobacteria bacterium]|nr:hypothetical protein [Alphaproteobacteria bacterium]
MGLALAEPTPKHLRDAPGDVMPARLWDVEHLELDLVLDIEAGRIEGSATHTLKPLGRPRDHVRLFQVGLDIEAVTVDGKPAEGFRIGPSWIDVPVPPSKAGHVVRIDYAAKPDLGLHFRGPAHGDRDLAVWSQGEDEDNRYWFPGWDTPNDAFTVTAHYTVRDGLLVRANGVETAVEPARPGWTKHTWAIEQPIASYHVAVVAGDLRAVSLEGRVPLEIVGPKSYDEAWLKGAADDAVAQMAFFEALLDEPFPYPAYRQAWVERFMYGGMENPGLTTLAARRMVDPARPDRVYESENLIAHELAHQWFGDLLTCYGWRELWLNEGFATYYAHRWMEEKHGADFAAVELWNRREWALGVEGPLATRAYSDNGRDNNGVYGKGASLLHMLRVYLGDAVYDEAIRRYVDANRFRFVESEDLRRAFEDASGEHLGWAFDQWVFNHGMPTWKSRWKHEDGSLTVTVERKDDGSVFHAPVEVEIGTRQGARTHRIWLGDGATRLVVPLDAPPEWVAVDPRGGLLGKLEQDQAAGSWLAQLGRTQHAFARVQAIHALAGLEPSDAGIAALDALANGNGDAELRRTAIGALADLSAHPAARESLLKASGAAHATVREAALDALRSPEGREAFVPRLLEALADDPDPANRASALVSLSKHDAPRAVALARKTLARKDADPNGIEHQLAAQVLGDHGTLDDGLALLRFLGIEHARGVRRRAADAVLVRWKDAEPGKKRDQLQERASRVLLGWLDDPDFRIRSDALRRLKEIGRPDDIPALQAYAARTPVAEHDALVLEVVRAIQSPPKAKGDPVEDLRKRLDALSDRLDDAAGRIERLEEWRE